MYNEHKSHPDCGLIYSQFVFCDAHLNRKGIGFCRAIPPGGSTLDAPVVSHFKTFKLRDYLKTDGYDQNILYAEDVDIVYKMEEVAPLRFVDECLYLYREVPDSISRSREKVNIAIMSRVKARVNALKRRCHAQARRTGCSFATLFRRALEEARLKHEDLEQYLVILSKLYENRMLDGVNWPSAADRWSTEDAVIWLAANVDVQFDKLFELIRRHRVSRSLPLVTVEMVAYNSESFIKQAIDSVLAQTYKNFELVLVDDGSTDGTAEIITSYSDPRIRYIRTPHRNCASARNRVIAEARGEYLLCVDSDDFIEPEYLEKMVAYAVEHPQIDYFYPGSLTLVDAAGNCTAQRWSYPDFSDPTTLPAFLFDKAYGPIPNPGSLKSRAMYRRIGGYDDVDSVEDFVFLCKNALKITFLRVEDNPTYFYRRRPGSSSQNFEVRISTLYNWRKTKPRLYRYLQNADYNFEQTKEINILLDRLAKEIEGTMSVMEIRFFIHSKFEAKSLDEIERMHRMFMRLHHKDLDSEMIFAGLSIYSGVVELSNHSAQRSNSVAGVPDVTGTDWVRVASTWRPCIRDYFGPKRVVSLKFKGKIIEGVLFSDRN